MLGLNGYKMTFIDGIVFRCVIFFFTVLSLLPAKFNRIFLTLLVRAVFLILVKHRKIALINLRQAFPDKDDGWRKSILRQSCSSIARLISDFARLPKLDQAWVSEHVEFPPAEILNKLSKHSPRSGVIFATGHLGSFELLAYSAAIKGFPLHFIVRNFKNKKLDDWWNARRALYGNQVISRKGAFNKASEALQSGQDLGILFDQNVTKNHAVFVDFFGLKAATTKTLGILAVRNAAPVMVVSIKHKGGDRYKINLVECDFKRLYQNSEILLDEKVQIITQTVSDIYQDMIQNDPAAWFWMHRRWKTRPEGEQESIY